MKYKSENSFIQKMTSKKDEKKDELFPVTTSKWNSNIEQNIKEIGESCKGYKWMHITSAKTAMQSYNILMFTTICIGPLGGLFGTISAARDECDGGASTLQVFVIVCAFISGVLASIVKYSQYNQKSIDHRTAAAKYTSLEGNVRRQLSLFREDRVNAGKYFQWVSVSFDDLFAGSPLITNDVYKEWVTFAQKHNLFVPKEYGLMVEMETDVKIKDLDNVNSIRVNNNESSANLMRDRAATEPHRTTPPKPPDTVVDIPEEKKCNMERRDSEPFKVIVDGEGTLKRNQTKRTERYTAFSELNRYGNGRMEYELGRMNDK
jgi:hypothetical protein